MRSVINRLKYGILRVKWLKELKLKKSGLISCLDFRKEILKDAIK